MQSPIHTRFYVEMTVEQRERIREQAKLTHGGDMRALVLDFIDQGLIRRGTKISPAPAPSEPEVTHAR